MAYANLQVYGVAISTQDDRLQGINIFNAESRLQGVTFFANNFFNGDILVTDESGNSISGATVSIVSTQTHVNNYIGDISGTTNSDGIFSATGSSTTGTTITVSKSGFHSYVGSLPTSLGPNSSDLTITLKEQVIQRVKVTNRGNIMINPNDGILIELD